MHVMFAVTKNSLNKSEISYQLPGIATFLDTPVQPLGGHSPSLDEPQIYEKIKGEASRP